MQALLLVPDKLKYGHLMPRIFTFFFCLFFSLSALMAQDEGEAVPPSESPGQRYSSSQIERHDFDEKKWQSLKEGIDYEGVEKKSKTKNAAQNGKGKGLGKGNSGEQEESEEVRLPSAGISGLGSVFKILGIVVLVGLLVLLIVKMAGGGDLFGPKNTKLKPSVSQAELDKIEENLHEAELLDPIQRAIAAGDYALATRLYYLSVLKELSVRNHIRWKRDKTNGAYLRELAGSPRFSAVQEVTLIFERIWYGKIELTRADFDQIEIKMKKAVATASA